MVILNFEYCKTSTNPIYQSTSTNSIYLKKRKKKEAAQNPEKMRSVPIKDNP